MVLRHQALISRLRRQRISVVMLLLNALVFQLVLPLLQQTALAQSGAAVPAYWLPICTTPRTKPAGATDEFALATNAPSAGVLIQLTTDSPSEDSSDPDPLAGNHCTVCHIAGCHKALLPGTELQLRQPVNSSLLNIEWVDAACFEQISIRYAPRGPPALISFPA